jgi:hypothetical protein
MRVARIAVLTFAAAMRLRGVSRRERLSPQPSFPPRGDSNGDLHRVQFRVLGILEKDKNERTKLTAQEIGEGVSKKLAEGYRVTLYPQANGKIFAIATCHPTKP